MPAGKVPAISVSNANANVSGLLVDHTSCSARWLYANTAKVLRRGACGAAAVEA
jgi:hypothetical protein